MAGIEKLSMNKSKLLPKGVAFSEKPTEIDYHGYRIFSFTGGKIAWSVLKLKPQEKFIGTFIGASLEGVKKMLDSAKP